MLGVFIVPMLQVKRPDKGKVTEQRQADMQRQKQQANGHDQVYNGAAKKIEVVFTLKYPQAREVYLCGDFNRWSPGRDRMFLRSGMGCWEKRVTLAPGRYEYKFLVDGQWVHDAGAPENRPNIHGSLNSVRVV